ncbi:MAG: hypothetical protein F6K65_05365 [Moorea sp. SIO3C2]|nr:hypothetical protein [Moorena sp. SIO3C2]
MKIFVTKLLRAGSREQGAGSREQETRNSGSGIRADRDSGDSYHTLSTLKTLKTLQTLLTLLPTPYSLLPKNPERKYLKQWKICRYKKTSH